MSENPAKYGGEIISADVCGPMQTFSIGGSRYFLLIKNNFSRLRKTFFLKNKNEVKDILAQVIVSIEKETENNIKVSRTYNDLEMLILKRLKYLNVTEYYTKELFHIHRSKMSLSNERCEL